MSSFEYSLVLFFVHSNEEIETREILYISGHDVLEEKSFESRAMSVVIGAVREKD